MADNADQEYLIAYWIPLTETRPRTKRDRGGAYLYGLKCPACGYENHFGPDEGHSPHMRCRRCGWKEAEGGLP